MLSPAFLIHQRSLSKNYWNIILTSILIYIITFHVYSFCIWPPQNINLTTILVQLFSLPYVSDYLIFITTCFYLSNLGYRFQTLNDFWKCLPPELVPGPDACWTQSEIAMLMESIRLLHSELSQQLRIFSFGFGPMLLGFFVCSFIDLIYMFYIIIKFEIVHPDTLFNVLLIYFPLHLMNVQVIVFILIIIFATSWINEKVNKNTAHNNIIIYHYTVMR